MALAKQSLAHIAEWKRLCSNPALTVKYWEIIADNLHDAGWSLGWISAIDREGRTIWIVDAHRDDGKRFIVHADEKLSAFVELEREVLTVTFYLEFIHADSCLD